MDQISSQQQFDEQVKLLLSLEQTLKDNDWTINVVYPYFFCTIHPKKHSEMIFTVRLDYTDYPERAPSLQFVDTTTKKEGKEFWPQSGNAFTAALGRKPEPQLCIQGVREFHEKIHSSDSDQKKYPWNPNKLTLPYVLLQIQNLLDEAYP